MSTPYSNFAPISYVHFVEYSFSLVCVSTTLFNMGRLIYSFHFNRAALRIKDISKSMQLYLLAHILCSVLSLPFLVFKVCWWRPPALRPEPVEPLYSAYPFFMLGSFYALYYAVSSILVFILCLDRCLVLKSNSWMDQRRRNWLIKLGIAAILVVYLGCGFGFSFELPLDLDKIKFCEFQSCQQINLKNYPVLVAKTIFGIANVICCAYFIRLITNIGGSAAENLDNRIIKITVFIEIFLNVIPGDTYIIYKAITGMPLSNYTGELSYHFMALEAAICGTFYWRKFRANPSDKIKALTSIRSSQHRGGGVGRQQPGTIHGNAVAQ